jgi:hypothetical protein
MSATPQLIAESAILAGLALGALYPFIDSTPHNIAKAHIAITDATSSCNETSAPSSIQVLVGVARGNAGQRHDGFNQHRHWISHSVRLPRHDHTGERRVPATVTDIVVVNANPNAPLTGVNTITASAAVR